MSAASPTLITDEDIALLRAVWRRRVQGALRELLDAEVEPAPAADTGKEPA